MQWALPARPRNLDLPLGYEYRTTDYSMRPEGRLVRLPNSGFNVRTDSRISVSHVEVF